MLLRVGLSQALTAEANSRSCSAFEFTIPGEPLDIGAKGYKP